MSDATQMKKLSKRAARLKLPFYEVSGVTGAGVPALLEGIWSGLTGRVASKPRRTARAR